MRFKPNTSPRSTISTKVSAISSAKTGVSVLVAIQDIQGYIHVGGQGVIALMFIIVMTVFITCMFITTMLAYMFRIIVAIRVH